MSDPICQLMEDIEGLCKRCYHLQKSNNEMYGKKTSYFLIILNFHLLVFFLSFKDYLHEDKQMQDYIDENEKIIEKYHRKINEICQLIKENNQQETDSSYWSTIALDYKKMEEEEKRSCQEKKKKFYDQQQQQQDNHSEDKGVYL